MKKIPLLLIVLFFTGQSLDIHAQTNMRGWHAARQTWLVWEDTLPYPETYRKYKTSAHITDISAGDYPVDVPGFDSSKADISIRRPQQFNPPDSGNASWELRRLYDYHILQSGWEKVGRWYCHHPGCDHLQRKM